MGRKTIGIFVGSLRRESFCKKVAHYLSGVLGEKFDIKFPDISSLAMYNEDLENDGNLPGEWTRFREEVKTLDAVLFITPEYNRSVSAVLKNALDVASRPYMKNMWNGKPGAVVSVSPGNLGGFGANHHLRQIATCLNINMMQQPEAYIGGIVRSVDENGVTDKGVQDFLGQFSDAFANWVNRLTA